MPRENASELAGRCTDLLRHGTPFPKIWDTVLKGHALVSDIPRSGISGSRPVLEIPLIDGRVIVFDGDARQFRIG